MQPAKKQDAARAAAQTSLLPIPFPLFGGLRRDDKSHGVLQAADLDFFHAAAVFAVKRPGKRFAAAETDVVGFEKADPLLVKALADKVADNGIQLGYRLGAANQQHLKLAVVERNVVREKTFVAGYR